MKPRTEHHFPRSRSTWIALALLLLAVLSVFGVLDLVSFKDRVMEAGAVVSGVALILRKMNRLLREEREVQAARFREFDHATSKVYKGFGSFTGKCNNE